MSSDIALCHHNNSTQQCDCLLLASTRLSERIIPFEVNTVNSVTVKKSFVSRIEGGLRTSFFFCCSVKFVNIFFFKRF